MQRCLPQAREGERGLRHPRAREGEAPRAQEETRRLAGPHQEARGGHVSYPAAITHTITDSLLTGVSAAAMSTLRTKVASRSEYSVWRDPGKTMLEYRAQLRLLSV